MRAFRGTHYTAPALRSMFVWEVAVLLDADVVIASRVEIPEHVAQASAPGGPRLRQVD